MLVSQLGQQGLTCQYEEVRMIFFIFILLCPMTLYSGIIHLKTILYSKCKNEQIELLRIQAVEPLLVNYLKNYRF